MLRSAAEAASHGIVFRRRLPSWVGGASIYTSTEAGLRYGVRRTADIDPPLLAAATRFVRPGLVVWDIGANVGLFAFAAAGLGAKRVIAVEADPWLARLLTRSAARNKGLEVDVLCAAAAADFGTATFHIARRSRSTNHLDGYGTTQTGGSRDQLLVATVPLDALLEYGQPDVIKIDVEGAELDALRGASAALRERPVVLCEVAAAASADVTALLHQAGYRLFDGESGAAAESAPYFTVAVPSA